MPPMGGALGSGWSLATLGAHAPWLHHCIEPQSGSAKHMVPHAPVIGLQIGPL
jgi:hypothetical protein